LLDAGWIEGAPAPASPAVDARRRYYRLTEAGRGVAAAEAERLERLVADARAGSRAPAPGHGKSGA
jgi:hypothetical protein